MESTAPTTGNVSVVYIHRDYNRGTFPQFDRVFPAGLAGKVTQLCRLLTGLQVEEQVLFATIDKINAIFVEAEKHTPSLYLQVIVQPLAAHFKNCLSCLSGFTLDMCIPNPYDKV